MGPLGSGQAAKAVNQVIICGYYSSVAEGLALGVRAGLDPKRLVEALSGGAAQSWVLANRSGRMIEGRYPPGFRLALHRKDLAIALELASSLGLRLPVAQLTAGLEDGLLESGRGDEDMSVLMDAIEGKSG
jgi:3-hydroxyisobutyrate dehydrogenase-like beta-hydroxyacid dehydrogenase